MSTWDTNPNPDARSKLIGDIDSLWRVYQLIIKKLDTNNRNTNYSDQMNQIKQSMQLINNHVCTYQQAQEQDTAISKLSETVRQFRETLSTLRDQLSASGGRRIKKRSRRHKKKRGKKTRRKRTRANRSKH
jgi:hypothetical protein